MTLLMIESFSLIRDIDIRHCLLCPIDDNEQQGLNNCIESINKIIRTYSLEKISSKTDSGLEGRMY